MLHDCVDGLVAAAVPSCSAPAQLLYQNLHPAVVAPVVTPQPASLPAGLLFPQPAATRHRASAASSSLTPLLSSELPRSTVHPHSVFVFVLVSAGDRNSVGSTGSVGSTRSAGSGQSTESTSAPNGLQHHSGHHDNTNKVQPDPESPDNIEMFLRDFTFRVLLSVKVVCCCSHLRC